MSERRTAEIKFRCTPSFKAEAEAEAEAAGQSLTAYVEAAVRARRSARRAEEVVAGAIEAEHAERIAKAGLGEFIDLPGPDATLRSMALEPSGSFRERVVQACPICSPSIPLVVDPKVPPATEAQWEAQNAALDSTYLVGNAIEALRERGAGKSAAVAKLTAECCAGHPVNAGTACDDCPATSKKDGAAAESLPPLYPNTCGCKPWAFCSCKAKAGA